MLDLDDKVMKAMAEMLDFSTARTRKAMDEAVDEVITEARRKLKSNQNNNNCHDATSHEGGGTKPLHGEQHSRISLLQRLLDAENSDAKKKCEEESRKTRAPGRNQNLSYGWSRNHFDLVLLGIFCTL